MNTLIDLRADGSEKVKYDYDDFRSYIRRGMLSVWPNHTADSHWHDDLEFISILSGYMDYNVNGEIIRLKAGQGIIVNSRQLHYGFSKEQKDCEFICILLHPMLLCTSQYVEHEFVAPLLHNSSFLYIFLDNQVEWQSIILQHLYMMCENSNKPTAPLLILSLFQQIWLLLIENTEKAKTPKVQEQKLSVLKDMLLFIQKHYNKKITISSIAKVGNVSASTCLLLFKKYLHDTPINYLIAYRLKQATKLLIENKATITEISYSVGFDSLSYFAETFKNYYNCTPSDFRSKYKTVK